MDSEKKDSVKFSLADNIYTFGVWVQEVQYCIRILRECREANKEIDVRAFLNLRLSCGIDGQFPEMKKMWNSIPEEDQPEWYSLLQLYHEISQLEELAQIPFG
ncbi:TPA: hypothetical protein ACF0M1_002342 [Enterococcus hirae]|uniref:Uncharacterized protein n=2 Tax=Enterococcus hirae TaxID=1354 RepID=G0YP70_ENTHA|nr:hypothetical protein [Enterococcus hirae]AEJ87190.1 hypothetical protein EHR_3027 [Enterococcus hirae ATCC 9790]EOH67497.1 hypothetical protein UAE_02726 [Enterococcus hirae ATCC 9790]EOU03357.1 hypothetical protein I584_02730 [Enterococcus hirae ATCC 9790]QQY20807.1 hypothetical protein I6I80_00390 [Enterococcus hirae]VTQ74158.1 Uncharacterised protein [Enterococcus hirae]